MCLRSRSRISLLSICMLSVVALILLVLVASFPPTQLVGTTWWHQPCDSAQWRTSAYVFAGGMDSTNIEEVFDDVLMDLTLKGDRPSRDTVLGATSTACIGKQCVTR